MKNEIIKYLNNEMSEAERVAFENRLEVDEQLSDEFARVATQIAFRHGIKQKLRKLDQEYPKTRTIHISPALKWVAILLLILIPTGVYLMQKESLICDEYMKYPGRASFRGDGGNANTSTMDKAFSLYGKGEFWQSAQLFESIANQNPDNNGASLYAGISLLWTKEKVNIRKSISFFDQVLVSNNPENNAALWFLAIALFESGEVEKAGEIFTQIAGSENHFRKEAAKEILEKYF
ncbi:MAG: hypothetical protein K9H64_00960 [Bacteroidales bacterium]|nr:hypothetical protein [Bacteroidales bacterium]MCF8454778.1 hypothetical protein [Bacteroidales bacterium]